MKLSARNVFKGKVRGIRDGAVNSEVIVELPGGNRNRLRYHEDFSSEPGTKSGRRCLRNHQGHQRHTGHGLIAIPFHAVMALLTQT
jgi:hypothetical protein